MMAGICQVCKEPLLHDEEIQIVGTKGHSSMVSASKVRQDNLHVELEEAEKPYRVHRHCFKDYSRKLSLESMKRKAESSRTCDEDTSAILRSQTTSFDIKLDCLYCTQKITDDSKKPKSRRRDYSCVETLPIIDRIISCAKDRKDEWGN